MLHVSSFVLLSDRIRVVWTLSSIVIADVLLEPNLFLFLFSFFFLLEKWGQIVASSRHD